MENYKNKSLSICVAQMDVVPGDPRANTDKMLKIIEYAKRNKTDLVLFSEMCVSGYLLSDMWERPTFVSECESCGQEIIKAADGIVVAFGNIYSSSEHKNEDGRIRKHNACYVAVNGQVASIVIKTLQPNYREFDDNRHFYDKRKMILDTMMETGWTVKETIEDSFIGYLPSISINGNDIGFLLCEDLWSADYSFSPVDALAPYCDLIVNLSCSPFTMGKNDKRNRVFSENAKKHNTPIIYVNNVGLQNNGKTVYTFDGESCIYDHNGDINILFDSFEENHKTISFNVDQEFAKYTPVPDGIEMIHKSIKYGIKKFLDQFNIKKVVIGASGGIDSAVVATLMAEVLDDPKNLYLVNMPSKFNSNTTKDLAKELADNIGCNYLIMPIEDSVDLTVKQLRDNGLVVSQLVSENIQARDRSSRILASVAASVGGVFTCNANKTEMTVGYTTMYGDLAGFLAPISDLWKGQVYGLACCINRRKEIIPQGSIDVIPSAELSNDQNVEEGKGDPLFYEYHDQLFKSWVERWDRATPEDILEWAIENTLEKNLGLDVYIHSCYSHRKMDIIEEFFNGSKIAFVKDLERWWNLFDGFAYAKRVQSPPVLAISRRAYGFDLRESQTKPFYSSRYYELKKQFLGELK